MKIVLKYILLIIITFTLSSCSSSGNGFSLSSLFSKRRCSNSYDANYKGSYKLGEPYRVRNKTYYPRHEPNYDEVGLASWYGGKFHCKKTANGESFNKRQFSAAHKTLPMPSVAQVTNLDNGKTIKVIINDRGPFVGNRIIDLSEVAAEKLSMKGAGVANVRVTYLEEETNMLLSNINVEKQIRFAGKNDKRRGAALNSKKYNLKEKPAPNIILAEESFKKTPYVKRADPQEVSIVVGEYNNKSEALKTVKSLSKIGYTKLSQFFKKGQPIYEVQVASSIRNNKHAEQLLKKIIDLGNKDAYLMNKN